MVNLAHVTTFGPVARFCREAKWERLHGSVALLAFGVLVLFSFPPAGVVVAFAAALMLSLSWRAPTFRERRARIEVIDGTLFVAGWPQVVKKCRAVVVPEGEVHRVQLFEGAARHPRVSVATYSADEAEQLRAALTAPAAAKRAEPDRSERLRVGLQRMNESGYRGASLEREHLREILDDPAADEAAREAAAMLLGEDVARMRE